MPVTIHVYDHSAVPNYVLGAVRVWNQALNGKGIHLTYSNNGPADCQKLNYQKGIKVCTDRCAIGWGGYSNGKMTKQGWKGYVVLCDTLLESTLPSYLCHELGHALGAGHSQSTKTCMTPKQNVFPTKPGRFGVNSVIRKIIPKKNGKK